MTSAIPPPTQNPSAIASSAASAQSHSASTTSSPATAVPAQLPTKPSYANATKTAENNTQSTSTGASLPVQHGKINSVSPVNGKSSMSSTSPTVGAHSGSANSTTNGVSRNDHGRKASVVISASGASGQIPNGGPVGQNTRPKITFGAVNDTQSSPSIVNSVPYASQTANLPTPRQDPRIISPAHSPSPIPQPQASGGKPPANLQAQGNGVTFGSIGMENGDSNVCVLDYPTKTLKQYANMNADARFNSSKLHSKPAGCTPSTRVFTVGPQ